MPAPCIKDDIPATPHDLLNYLLNPMTCLTLNMLQRDQRPTTRLTSRAVGRPRCWDMLGIVFQHWDCQLYLSTVLSAPPALQPWGVEAPSEP